jgi:triphosphoribosyl-dephospho-CoA synthase
MAANGRFEAEKLRENMNLAVKATTPEDAVQVYDAIAIASPSGLNKAPDLDVTTDESKNRLLNESVSLFQVFQIAASYDDICYEWVNGCPTTFDLAFPYLISNLKLHRLNTAIVDAFLKVLAERP